MYGYFIISQTQQLFFPLWSYNDWAKRGKTVGFAQNYFPDLSLPHFQSVPTATALTRMMTVMMSTTAAISAESEGNVWKVTTALLAAAMEVTGLLKREFKKSRKREWPCIFYKNIQVAYFWFPANRNSYHTSHVNMT